MGETSGRVSGMAGSSGERGIDWEQMPKRGAYLLLLAVVLRAAGAFFAVLSATSELAKVIFSDCGTSNTGSSSMAQGTFTSSPGRTIARSVKCASTLTSGARVILTC